MRTRSASVNPTEIRLHVGSQRAGRSNTAVDDAALAAKNGIYLPA